MEAWQVKPVQLIDLEDNRVLMLTSDKTIVLTSREHIEFALVARDRANETLEYKDIRKIFGDVPEGAFDIFFRKLSSPQGEIASIAFHGDSDKIREVVSSIPMVRKLISGGDGVCLNVVHSETLSPTLAERVEDEASDNDLVLISTFIRDQHVVIGPVIRAFSTPRFSDFFSSWQLFEENRLNDNRSWYSVMDFAMKENIELGSSITRDESIDGLCAFHLSRSIRKLISANPPLYHWDEAAGVSFCHLESGKMHFDALVHSILR
ncbi:hypothetical protein [Halomonas caseinilytica]|uniref:Uncharacterized protein n=1 Tax=Halomonas caseinilytica TaxID=438744 RepID=A0A1M6V7A6_9GAMM|nr:hypothetical protein [Halomonas caseinilytica]SHK77275.1 hypothetical protein SAMN05192556_105114 [Halomonas caseinilytica]